MDVRQLGVRAGQGKLLGVAGALALLVGCSKSTAFRNMTYDKHLATSVHGREVQIEVAASMLAPSMMEPYLRPTEVGACLKPDDALVGSLLGWGRCRAASLRDDSQDCTVQRDALLATVRTCKLFFDEDRISLGRALLAVGESAAVWDRDRGVLGYGAESETSGAGDVADIALGRVLAGAKRVLANTVAPRPTPIPGDDSQPAPALALSGGSANGAFTAGFFRDLLRAREARLGLACVELAKDAHKDDVASSVAQSLEASGHVGASREQCRALAAASDSDDADVFRTVEAYRFAGAGTTSVGTLVGVLLDLYANDGVPQDDAPGGRRTDVGSVADALRLLDDGFVVNEWEVLCARPGSFFRVLPAIPLMSPGDDRDNSFLRFDPLLAFVRKEVDFQRRGDAMLANDFVQVPLAIDLELHRTEALDERGCLAQPPEKRELCWMSSIAASLIVAPYAEPFGPVYPAHKPEGSRGTWIDGGFSSGTPADPALRLTQGHVLAVNTNRLDGVPHEPDDDDDDDSYFENGLDVLFGGLGHMVDQTRVWEQAFVGAEAVRRERDRCEVARALSLPTTGMACGPTPTDEDVGWLASPTLRASKVRSIWVPADIDRALVAGGYQFDPTLTSGLWLWGRLALRTQVDGVAGWLGFDLLRPGYVEPNGNLARSDAAYGAWSAATTAEAVADLGIWRHDHAPNLNMADPHADHVDERKALLKRFMAVCPDPTDAEFDPAPACLRDPDACHVRVLQHGRIPASSTAGK